MMTLQVKGLAVEARLKTIMLNRPGFRGDLNS
jgi:hypothetical protein